VEVVFDGLRPIVRGESADLEQAGAIVYRGDGEARRVLLVTNKEGDRWLLPKGSIKKKENAEEAARRESVEESGVDGHVVAYAGAVVADEDGKIVRVDYFLLKAQTVGKAHDHRQVRWCTAQEVLELVSHPQLKEFLQKALPEIMSFANPAA
jgi:8-oxo-dGTP pyrophosphatase MutT (NUDIX family)